MGTLTNGIFDPDVRPDGTLRSVWEGGWTNGSDYAPPTEGQWTWKNWTISKIGRGYVMSHGTEGFIAMGDEPYTVFQTFARCAQIAEDREACAQ